MKRVIGAAKALIVAALFALPGIAPAAASQSAADSFLRDLRSDVRSGNRAAVVARIQFPIVVRMAGLRIPFPDAAALLPRYDDIFTPALREIIALADAPTTGPNGFALGTNAVIVTQSGDRMRITEINVPPAAPGGTASSTPGTSAAGGSRGKGPIRVGIRGGPRPTQFSGLLERGGVDTYLLFIPKGRLLDARLERIRGREALIHVVHAASGAPLNPRTASGARIVTGIPTKDGEYRIEVRRSDSPDAAPVTYLLSLSLK